MTLLTASSYWALVQSFYMKFYFKVAKRTEAKAPAKAVAPVELSVVPSGSLTGISIAQARVQGRDGGVGVSGFVVGGMLWCHHSGSLGEASLRIPTPHQR